MAAQVDFGASWADVTPLPLNEAPDAPFAIAYSARYSLVHGYVRAAQASGERSARVLQLTAEAAELNPAHYTVWSLRRQCLEALVPRAAAGAAAAAGAWSLPQELEWLAALMRRKGAWKNYQVWHHRRLVVERLGDGSREMDLTSEAFGDCPKNYHAWSHRQWAVAALTGGAAAAGAAGAAEPPLGSWQAELAFAEALLAEDVRNNSAWNHRWFVLTRGGGAPRALPRARWPAPADLAREVALCAAALRPVRRNEAAWSHLRACVLLARVQRAAAAAAAAPAASTGCMEDLRCAPADLGWGAWPEVLALARECQAGSSSSSSGGDEAAHNAAACEVLAEHAEASGDGAGARLHYARAGEGDAIRAQYWKWREAQVVG